MKEKIGISVIVVTYNQEDTLGRTLDSILAQEDCGPYEILVSDDCSADGTAEVARGYAARYPDIVKVHVNERNVGVQRNYFDCMRRAEGEYIADCAGDDFWCDPRKLARQRAILDGRPEVSMVHTGFHYAHADGRREEFRPLTDVRVSCGKSHDALREILCGKDTPFLHLCSALYRKAPVLEALDLHPDLFLDPAYKCEDLQVMAAVAAAGDVVYLPEPMLCYSVGHSSISSTESYAKTFDFYFATTQLRLKLLKLYDFPASDVAYAMRHYTDFLMAQAFHAGSRTRLKELYRWMRKEHIALSTKAGIFYIAGCSVLNRPLSRMLLARRPAEDRHS